MDNYSGRFADAFADVQAAKIKRLERKAAQLEAALQEWHDKTEWLRKDLQPHEVGKHLADVLRERCDAT